SVRGPAPSMKRALQSFLHDSAQGEVGAEMAAGSLRCMQDTTEIAIENDVALSDPRSRDGSSLDRPCGCDRVPAFADDVGVCEAGSIARGRLGLSRAGSRGRL